MGTHLKVLSEGDSMSTNMTGLCVLDESSLSIGKVIYERYICQFLEGCELTVLFGSDSDNIAVRAEPCWQLVGECSHPNIVHRVGLQAAENTQTGKACKMITE